MLFKIKLVKTIFLVVGLILIAWLVYGIYNYYNFSIVSTSPNLNTVATLSPYIKIDFNHTLSNKNIFISAPNNLLYSHKYYVNGKTLTIQLNEPLSTDKKYSITIDNLIDNHGQKIKNKVISFIPKKETLGQLSKNAQEELIIRNESSTIYKNPILSHLPYFSVDFSLSADFTNTSFTSKSKLALNAQLTIPAAYVGSSRQNYINQDKQQVISYISSLGLNPSNYIINYYTTG